MKNIILLFLFLVPAFLFAQYPATGNKQRLGYQTTGDGLIWRGVAADTAIKPRTTANAYFQLDTVNRILRRYIATQGSWQVVGGGTNVDSLIYATRYWVSTNFFPIEGGTLTGTGGAGFIGFPSQVVAPGTPASGLNVFASGSAFNWKGTDGHERQFASTLTGGRTYTLPDVSGTFALGTGTATRIPIWTSTNALGDSPILYNSTTKRTTWDSPGVIELPMGSTAQRPSPANTSDFWYNTNGYPEFYNGSSWDEMFTPWQRGSSYIYYGTDPSNTRWDVSIQGTSAMGLGIIRDLDYYGMEVGESATKTGGFYWRNSLERVDFTTNGNSYPIAFGANWLYLKPDGKIHIGGDNPLRTLHVSGEARITDLVTDPPNAIVGHDSENDLATIAAGNGVNISNSQLNIGAGYSWTSVNITGSPSLIGVAYGNGRFVAVSFNGKFFTSEDGRGWIERTAPAANQWISVAYGNGIFVAVSYNGTNRVATSNDGITWTARSATEANQWTSVCYGNNQFVAVSETGTNRVMTSSDGITWAARSASSASGWYRVKYANGLYVAVATSGANQVMTSSDGITWTNRTAAAANQWRGLTYGNGLWVAVSDNGTNRIMTSSDAITWTSRTLTTGTYFDAAFGNGIFVACDQAGGVATSNDGVTWVTRSGGGGRSITFEEGLFVSTLFSGSIQVSGSKTIRQPWNNIFNGDWRYNQNLHVVDSTRLTTTPAHSAITGLLTRDANGWIGLASLAGGLSYSGGVLTGLNGIYSGSGTLSQTDTYAEMDATGTKSFGIGWWPDFPNRTYAYDEIGLLISPSGANEVALSNQKDYISLYNNSIYFGANEDNAAVQINGNDAGSFTFYMASNTKNATWDTSGLSWGYKILPRYGTKPATTSAAKTVLQWTGDGSNANPSFVEVKRDTTIFVTADTDYDFSAAVTTAQIASRYNRIIIHMTLTSGVGVDKTTTLHTPDANLMQCEILIRGTDNTGTYDNEINFGTNNAISSDGTNASGYTLAQGQGLHVRVVYNGSAYKYIYY